MPNFKKYNYDQNAMVVINFEEQIRPGTFEFTLHHLIDSHIDLSVFHEKYRNDTGGRSAYDPAILLKIILFAYSKGVTSSRDIQWECEHNIIFKALACDSVPHFTSITHFISSYPDAIESVFEQVLLVCDQQGLLGLELFAIDGCKMSSNAAKEHSGTLEELAAKRGKIRKRIRQTIQEHKKLDGRNPQQRDRKKQLGKAAATLEKEFNRIDQFLKTAAPRMGQGRRPKEVKSNMTDNESGKMTTNKGTLQGYNGVAAVDEKHQIIVDAQAFGEGQEHHTLEPMINGISKRCANAGIHDAVFDTGVILTADTGFSNEANDRLLKVNQINAYIPDNRFRARDKQFIVQKEKYGKRHRDTIKGIKSIIPSSEFTFEKRNNTCICPTGKKLRLRGEYNSEAGKY